MKEYQSLAHTRWDCKYHVVFIPKRRKKAIFGRLRQHLGEIFREVGESQGIGSSRRAPETGSRAHVSERTTEVLSLARSGAHQGQKCDSDCPEVWRADKELYRRSFLGQRIL
jgi:hypothetical protein